MQYWRQWWCAWINKGTSFCWVCCVCLWRHPAGYKLTSNFWVAVLQLSSKDYCLPGCCFLFLHVLLIRGAVCRVKSDWTHWAQSAGWSVFNIKRKKKKNLPPCRLHTWHQNMRWLTTSRCPRLPLATFSSEPLTKSMIPSLPRATANLILHIAQEVKTKTKTG